MHVGDCRPGNVTISMCMQIRVLLYRYLHCRYTAISKNVVIVTSPYWNRKELWASNSRNNLLLLALTLHNIECRFIIEGHSHTVTTFVGVLSLIMTVPKVPFGSSIDY